MALIPTKGERRLPKAKKRRKILCKVNKRRKEFLLMMYDRVCEQEGNWPVPSEEQMLARLMTGSQALVPSSSRRGRPASLTALHLCLGIVLCGLRGFGSQRAFWRLLCVQPIGPFAPVQLVDQAVYNRLERAAGLMAALFEHVSAWLRQQLAGLADQSLAPFATQVLALDESKLDAVGRWLPHLRALLAGNSALLAGRISALFDVRLQQWVRVDILQEASANCKLHATQMLTGLAAGTLLLFDRGYLSFPFFDELSARGIFWISRYANEVSYQVRHVFYQGDGVLDAIVYLGCYRRDQAKYPVRLVQFYRKGRRYRYLSNVLDPQVLPVREVARLYARRWDIELAFRVLKEHLQLSQLWSAKWEVLCVQIWAGLLLAQLFHGLQVQLAAEAGVDPFAVSIDVLVEVVPQLLDQGIAPLPYLRQRGEQLGVIRPSSRIGVETPFIDASWIIPAPAEALQPREQARYAQRRCQRWEQSPKRKGGSG
jgi:hypothetical protein